MDTDKQNNKRRLFIIIIILVAIIVSCVLFATKVIQIKLQTNNTEVLDKIVGTYANNDTCSYINITKENDKYFYDWIQEASGGFRIPAPITNTVDKGNNIYELTIDHPEEEGSSDGSYPHREAEIEKITVNLLTHEVTINNKLTDEKIVYKVYDSTSEQLSCIDKIYNNNSTKVLDEIVGSYADENTCSHIDIKKENDEYFYSFWMEASGGFREPGLIINVANKDDNTYELTIHHKAEGPSDDPLYPEETKTIIVNLSTKQIKTKHKIIIGDITYDEIIYKKYDSNTTELECVKKIYNN